MTAVPRAMFDVAVIAGDGIGNETVPAAMAVVDRCAELLDFSVGWTQYDWGAERYRRTGTMMPSDGLEVLEQHDAILFGAVGAPDIPDTVTLWGLLIPIRRGLDQYVNLRPVRHVAGVPSPLAHPEGIDLVVVRENVEGEYSETGGRSGMGCGERAVQQSLFTRRGIARVAAYAAQLAQRRSGRLTSATKSNGILHTMPFWDEIVAQTVSEYDGVQLRSVLIDALAAAIVRRPQDFDVIVASNLFGDILSDLTAACVGSLGLAASANLNPERQHPSLFEPVHGSAPDIAGKGVANPLAQISAAALMLDHLGITDASELIDAAVEATLRAGPRTPDLRGNASTTEVTVAVCERLGQSRSPISSP